jgi:hypothetical protein
MSNATVWSKEQTYVFHQSPIAMPPIPLLLF